MNRQETNIISGFARSAERFPDRPALEVEKQTLTYRELLRRASAIAATLDAHATGDGPPLTAIFASRSVASFAGVIATLLRGHGYVPLSNRHPPGRIEYMLRHAGCRTLVVDSESARLLDGVIGNVEHRLVLLLPELEDTSDLKRRHPRHVVLGAHDIVSAGAYAPRTTSPDSLCYLLFTSGSTGVPKGVMIAHRNVLHFLDFMADRYGVTEEDRLSQTFNLTFDPSVFDMFVAWGRGACVCCPSQKALLNPAKFINDSRLTIWYSVPALGIFMKRLGSLKKGNFPTLRFSLFAGEPLPAEVVTAWAEAAPGSVVENLYGPTELTVTCLYYRWNSTTSAGECFRGVVPIGYPNPGMTLLICDDRLREVPPGETGELLMAGPQVALGYWKDAEKTAGAFVTPPGRDERHYRTGDLVRRPRGPDPILYVGRIDSQLKILGQRVEMGEIEAIIREESGISGVVALGWPLTIGGADGVEVFLEERETDVTALRRRIATRLPDYMLPKKFHFIDRIPLNENGKCDRGALQSILKEKA